MQITCVDLNNGELLYSWLIDIHCPYTLVKQIYEVKN